MQGLCLQDDSAQKFCEDHLCVNLTGPCVTQILNQTLFWVFLSGGFWMTVTFKLVDLRDAWVAQ